MSGQRYGSLLARIEANTYKDPETGCWIWIGATSGDGYGRITLRVTKVSKRHRRKSTTVKHPKVPVGRWVHRVAYELTKGVKLHPDDTLDHRCPCGPDKRCWNDEHLKVVSRSINTKLAWARRRAFERGEPATF